MENMSCRWNTDPRGNEINVHQTSLVSKALWIAIKQKRPLPGLIQHSERGSQYASTDY
jgi:hypothetical protein